MPGGQTVYFSGGSYLDAVRSQIADRNWVEFFNSWHISTPDIVQRDLTRAIASKFNLQGREDASNELFKFANDARTYEKNQKGSIEQGLANAYRFAASLAAGDTVNEPSPFDRAPTTAATNLVVFSDMHMTALDKLPNYFEAFNYQLYLDVLDFYAGAQFTLVENGDVEDCLVYDPTLQEAEARSHAAPRVAPPIGWSGTVYIDPQSGLTTGHFELPIKPTGPKWQEFMRLRYAKRLMSQEAIIGSFGDYYERVKSKFIKYGRYYQAHRKP